MKKDKTEDELQGLWNENLGSLAYDLEEAFLEVFRNKGAEFQKPAFFIGAIAMAAGHVLQVTEKELDYKFDCRRLFDDVLQLSYDFSKACSSDEKDDDSLVMSQIDLSMLN